MDELSYIKKLAGINEFKGFLKYDPVNPYSGSNISLTGNEKGELQKKHGIEPGTPEWFQLWFSLPKLTGENPVGQGIRSKK